MVSYNILICMIFDFPHNNYSYQDIIWVQRVEVQLHGDMKEITDPFTSDESGTNPYTPPLSPEEASAVYSDQFLVKDCLCVEQIYNQSPIDINSTAITIVIQYVAIPLIVVSCIHL